LQGQDNKRLIYFLSILRERRLISKPFISLIFNFFSLVFHYGFEREALYEKKKIFKRINYFWYFAFCLYGY